MWMDVFSRSRMAMAATNSTVFAAIQEPKDQEDGKSNICSNPGTEGSGRRKQQICLRSLAIACIPPLLSISTRSLSYTD
jgi:hypothetical protein